MENLYKNVLEEYVKEMYIFSFLDQSFKGKVKGLLF